jgi:chromosome segregation ATPase
MATSTLGVLLESLIEVSANHERAVAELATRISGAVGSLADPDAVARDLQAARQELADKLRQAQSEVDQAHAKEIAAGKAQRLAMSERDEAVSETVQALERVEELEAQVGRIQAEMKALEEAAGKAALDHSQELIRVASEYEASLNEAIEARQRSEGALGELRAEMTAIGKRHESEIKALRDQHADDLVAVRAGVQEQLDRALVDQAKHLDALHKSELTAALAQGKATAAEAEARHTGELAKSEAALAAAKELGVARLDEIGRLVAQLG